MTNIESNESKYRKEMYEFVEKTAKEDKLLASLSTEELAKLINDFLGEADDDNCEEVEDKKS